MKVLIRSAGYGGVISGIREIRPIIILVNLFWWLPGGARGFRFRFRRRGRRGRRGGGRRRRGSIQDVARECVVSIVRRDYVLHLLLFRVVLEDGDEELSREDGVTAVETTECGDDE